MKKQITTIALGIIMLAGVMAMYAGDSITFETNLTNPVYTVTGNQSSLEGLNITFENGNISISPALNYKPDNFTIIFFDNITREVVKTIYRGGGGGSSKTKYVDRDVTVYIPQYIDTTKEVEKIVEVEKIIDNTTVIEIGYKLWMILLAIAVGGVFVLFIMWINKEKPKEEIVAWKEKSADEIIKEVEEDKIKNEKEANKLMEYIKTKDE